MFAHLKNNERKVRTPYGEIPCESTGIHAITCMTDSATENIPPNKILGKGEMVR